MAHACTCHRRGSTDEEALTFELDVARSALREGELAHAKHHVAGAIAIAPTEVRVHTVLGELAKRLDLTVVPESGWFGEFALAAFASHAAGQREKAIGVLASVTSAAPSRGFEHALTSWLAQESALEPETAGRVAHLLGSLTSSTIGLNHLLDGERHLLGSFAGLADVYASLESVPERLGGAAGLLRRLGRTTDSLKLARRIPGPAGRVMEGLAHRAPGDGLSSLAAFEAAEKLEADTAYPIEQARALFVAGEGTRAAALLSADSIDPEVAALRSHCATPPATAMARVEALDSMRRSTLVAADFPHDATASMFARIEPGTKGLRVAVSGWEGPTNRLLLAVFAGHTDVREVTYTRTFKDFDRPVMAQVRGSLSAWVERGGVTVQALPAPRAELRSSLAAAADMTASVQLSNAAAFAAVSAKELVAAMVHPPEHLARNPDLADAVFDYQVACALALTAHGGTRGLESLESLIFGPVDWVSAAAVVALGEWTHRAPGVAHKGRELLLAAIDDLLPHSAEPGAFPLIDALMFLPGVPASAREVLGEWCRANLNSDQADD